MKQLSCVRGSTIPLAVLVLCYSTLGITSCLEPLKRQREEQAQKGRLQVQKATIRNESCCRQADPSLPWLPVLQGDTLSQRQFDLQLRRRLGLLPGQRAGIGSENRR